MSANLKTPAIENPVEQNGGVVWNRLHSEREDICEALLKEPIAGSGTETAMHGMSKEDALRATNWHRELLQARLRKIDDALDRLMSGSYGDCGKCGKWIEDTKLEFDPAIAFCISCWEREQRPDERTSLTGVALETLAPFDTIWTRTHNSDYRIFLLEPKTGRALVEGGQFVEPVEAMVNGSTLGSSRLRSDGLGWDFAQNSGLMAPSSARHQFSQFASNTLQLLNLHRCVCRCSNELLDTGRSRRLLKHGDVNGENESKRFSR